MRQRAEKLGRLVEAELQPKRRPLQHRLDVHHWRAIDRFNRANPQPIPVDRADDNRVKTQRVRPIRRSGGKDTGKRIARVGSRMHLENVAPCPMKPRDDDQLVAHGDTV
jgi:hypothetical protein